MLPNSRKPYTGEDENLDLEKIAFVGPQDIIVDELPCLHIFILGLRLFQSKNTARPLLKVVGRQTLGSRLEQVEGEHLQLRLSSLGCVGCLL